MAKGDGTRSGLLWEVERLLNECTELPQVLLMENVPQVHSPRNKEHFDKWIQFLESKGYSNYWKDLNAKNYGIPQSRNRCYMVSILGNHSFEFPKSVPLQLRLRDMLETNVSAEYYLRTEIVERLINVPKDKHGPALLSSDTECSKTITTRVASSGNFEQYIIETPPFISFSENAIRVREATKLGYAEAREGDSVNIEFPNSTTRRGRVGKQVAQTIIASQVQGVVVPKVIGGIGEKKSNGGRQWYQQDRIYDDEVAISVTTAFNPYYATKGEDLRIRKLTPKECWRLMGFDDEDFEKASKVCSKPQLYKQAGNSIVVNVLMAIFKELFIPKMTRSEWLDSLLGDSL